ncbi:hypothetical protein [Paenibacillus sp. YAF4_2]
MSNQKRAADFHYFKYLSFDTAQ